MAKADLCCGTGFRILAWFPAPSPNMLWKKCRRFEVEMKQRAILKPFNLQQWIEDNRHLLKPPIGNQQVFIEHEDFIVMVVGGPNARKDFHINEGEELFYQLEGEIEVGLMIDDEKKAGKKNRESVTLKAGDIFLLPPRIPHSPQRGAGTIGLVIERRRKPGELDGFQWYCENCGNLMQEVKIPVSDIVNELPRVMNNFFNSKELCTCKNCGTVLERP